MRSESQKTPLYLLRHPYRTLHPVTGEPDQLRREGRARGSALVWIVDQGMGSAERTIVETRPGGLPVLIVLPDTHKLAADSRVVRAVGLCRPHGILPYHERPVASDLAQVLRRPPEDLGAAVTDYLRWRRIEIDRDTVHLIRKTIDLSGDVRSITALSRSMYLSRRALGRRFLSRGLPVPSHWLQFGRLLRVLTLLQNRGDSVFSVGYELGYPDGFALSNQMHRLVGCRPSEAREYLGWEWFMEAWLRREAEEGGLAPRYAAADAEAEGPPSIPPAEKRAEPKRSRRMAG